jgi:hypothetical protein
VILGLFFLVAAAVGLSVTAGSAYLYYRMERKSLFIFAILICAAVAASGSMSYLPMVSTPFILGAVGGLTFKKGKSLEFYLMTTTLILTALSAGFFYFYLFVLKVDFFEMQRSFFVQFMGTARVPPDIRKEWLGAFEESKYLVPFGTFMNSVIFSSAAYIVIKRILFKVCKAERVSGLEFFRISDYWIFVLIAGLALFLLVDSGAYQVVHIAGLNIMLGAALLYFIQGVGVIKYLLTRRGVPGYVIPLAFAGLFLIGFAGLWASMFLSVIIAGMGALDIWADFRNLTKKKDTRS